MTMNLRSVLFRFVMLAALLGGGAAVAASARDLNAVRESMAQRLPELDRAKASGEVGEDNRGFVAQRAGGDEVGVLVGAENGDRRLVYTALAQRTGSTAEAVGVARARQISAQSAPGIWLQGADGAWYRK